MVTKKINLAQNFAGAVQATRQEQRILDLQAEVDRLRMLQAPEIEEQIETLREELRSQHGEQNIPIDKIKPNANQPRQTISKDSVSAIARSLDKDGQITPVILIPESDTSYLIWDGERRWRGAKSLGWSTLRAVISPMPEDLHRKALLTFLHHEDLNPLDKSEAVVNEISRETEIPEDLVPSGVRALVRRLERQEQTHIIRSILNEAITVQEESIQNLEISEEQQLILKVLLDLQINPASFAANDLQMLTLQDDLKLSIRNSGLRGAHALVLQKLSEIKLNLSPKKSKRIRQDATAKVLKEQLTVTQTKTLVRSLLKEHNSQNDEVGSARRVNNLIKSLDSFDLDSIDTSQLLILKDELAKFLTEINKKVSA